MTGCYVRIYKQIVTLISRGILLWLVCVFPNAKAADTVVLQLKWNHQFQFAGYYAALKEGYFADEGLDVTLREVIPGETAVEAVLKSEAQYGVSDSSLALSRLRGDKVVVLATIFQQSPLVLITLQSSGITHPLDLRGKRVMYRENIDDAVLQAMFVEVRLKRDEFTHVPQSFDVTSLLKDVDAISVYTTNQPYYFASRDIPINILSPANFGIDFYGDMLFTSEAYLRDNPQQVEAFRRASIRGWEYAVTHPEAVIDWMLANIHVQSTREHLLFEAERTIRLIKPDLVEIGHFTSRRFRRIAEIYRELKLAPPDSELTGLDYRDHLQIQTVDPQRLKIISMSALLALFLLLLLFWLNNRLRHTVRLRTAEIQAANNELEHRHELLDQHVALLAVDPEGMIARASEAFLRLTGFDGTQLLNIPFNALLDPHADGALPPLNAPQKEAHSDRSAELKLRHRNGQSLWVRITIVTDNAASGEALGNMLIFEDITDKKKILHLSVTDSLTDVANRRRLEHQLNHLTEEMAERWQVCSLLLFDLDHFKAVNDTYGHNKGDEVLIAVARLVESHIRELDTIGRWGGEEFMVICPGLGKDESLRLAETLRHGIEQLPLLPNQAVTASFGIAQWSDNASLNTLFNRADHALYAAKEAGRNCVRIE